MAVIEPPQLQTLCGSNDDDHRSLNINYEKMQILILDNIFYRQCMGDGTKYMHVGNDRENVAESSHNRQHSLLNHF